MRRFEELNQEVQKKVKKVLKAYDEANVVFEYGEFHVSPGMLIKAEYAEDHEFVGTYYAKDVFTENERILNYMECFHDYHPKYKGERDYRWLNSLTNQDRSFKFDENGNIVKA